MVIKSRHIVSLCLTIYLSVFTHGCWNAVGKVIDKYEYTPVIEQKELPKIEKPQLSNDIPQLFIIPTPQLQNEVPEDDGKPKTFANN